MERVTGELLKEIEETPPNAMSEMFQSPFSGVSQVPTSEPRVGTANCMFEVTGSTKVCLLVYYSTVLLLAWWPWNVLLILIGAAYAGRLKVVEKISGRMNGYMRNRLRASRDRRSIRDISHSSRNTRIFLNELQSLYKLVRII